jgi:hypothetical protein
MPTYSFFNEESGVEWDEFMTISELDTYLKSNSSIKQLPPGQMNIIAGRMGGMRNDDGWRENMARIAEAHPTSAVGGTYGDKSIKAVKTREAVDKWKKKRAVDSTL